MLISREHYRQSKIRERVSEGPEEGGLMDINKVFCNVKN